MTWTRLIESLFFPPVGSLWLILLGLVLLRTRYRRGGRVLLAVALATLFIAMTPVVGELLAASLDRYPPLPPHGDVLPEAECVVILSAGSRSGARELGRDTVAANALERLHYGARLAERTGRPVMVSGSSGEAMAEALENGFRTPVRFIENESHNTHQNASYSARLLRGAGIRRIYLVTHYWHMPRAVAAFEAAGLEPVPAPLGFKVRKPSLWWLFRRLLPSAHAFSQNKELLHEWVGRLWYRLRYGY